MHTINTDIDDDDAAWAAGLLSTTGSFQVVAGSVRIAMRSSRHTEAIERFGRIFGVATQIVAVNGKDGINLSLGGGPLHEIMKVVWPQLTRARKQEYAAARKRAAAYDNPKGDTEQHHGKS